MADLNDPNAGNRVHASGTEARAGATPKMTRYILGASLALIMVLFAILLLI